MQHLAIRALMTIASLLALGACSHEGFGGHAGHRGEHGSGGPDTHGEPAAGLQLKHFDLDGDGNVSRVELDRGLHAMFAKYDVDHDSVLSATEARALNQALTTEIPGASPVLDWNADGHIDFNEFANQWLSLFERLDANSDGVVTAEEMTPRMRTPGGEHGEHGGGGRHGGSRGGDQPGGGR